MMLVIRTQCRENYGTDEQPYWKSKGGQSYKITNVPSDENIKTIIENINNIEHSNSMFEEFVINWSWENDDYLSEFEKSQLEYDGKILYKEPTMMYNELTKERIVS